MSNKDLLDSIKKLREMTGVGFKDCKSALDENNGDIIFLMNLNTKTCIMRKSKSCDIHMGKLAETLADGGGHEDAAGCLVNDTIINITKLLEPVCQ